MTDSSDLLALAERLADEAGRHSLARLAEPWRVRTKSSATDVVTEVDEECERLIVDGIRTERPDDGVLSEEGASAESTSGVRWVIDPIDGTTNYLYRQPGYGISIAAEIDGEVVAGVVNDPLHGERFVARKGSGAFLNGEPIAVSNESELSRALVATGFGYDASVRVDQARTLVQLIGSIRDIRRTGAAAVDLCWVACGRVDAYYELGLNHWDLAAGALIASEAGAAVGELRSGVVVAAPPALYGPLGAAIAAA